MSISNSVGNIADSARRGAWDAGGVVLLALRIGSIAVALAGLIFAGGGVVFFPLAVPPLAAGYGLLRRVRGARLFGFGVAVAYAISVAYIATTPLRGLTPPPGHGAASIDPGPVLVAVDFLAAAILIVFGKADRRTGGR